MLRVTSIKITRIEGDVDLIKDATIWLPAIQATIEKTLIKVLEGLG